MRPETKKYLYDMLKACEAIFEFTEGKDLASYESDCKLGQGTRCVADL